MKNPITKLFKNISLYLINLTYPKKIILNHEEALNKIKLNSIAFKYVASGTKYNTEFLRSALRANPDVYGHFPEYIKNDRMIILALLTVNPLMLKQLKWVHRDDEILIEKAVQNNGLALQYASKRLKDNRKIVLEAVKNDGRAWQYASKFLRNNDEITLTALCTTIEIFPILSEKFRLDWEFLYDAVKINPHILEKIDCKTFGYEKIVEAALKKGSYALCYVPHELQTKDWVLLALEGSGMVIQYANEELRHDREIIIKALMSHGESLKEIPEKFKYDKELVLLAVSQIGYAFTYVPEPLTRDREVVIAALKQNGNTFQYIPEDLKSDQSLMLEALKQDQDALVHMPKSIREAIGEADPVKYMESQILYEKIDRETFKKKTGLAKKTKI